MAKKKVETANKLTIKTSKLQEMVIRAEKGASNNKILPITQMLAIKLESNVLTLITTDATNYLYIREDKVDGADFYAVVPVDKFVRLISRMTCDSITLELKEKVLEVSGNGTYSIDLEFDDDGTMVQYPSPLDDFESESETEINKTTVDTILTAIKPALATGLDNPCYTGYHVGEQVVATDSFLINILNVKMFEDAKLVSAEVMNLLSVMESEKIKVMFNTTKKEMVFETPDCVVYGRDLEGIEDFAIDDIIAYTEMEFASKCKLPKANLLQLFDRLSLFVTDYDKGGIYLTFTKDGLQVSSMNTTGVEVIPYVESENFKDFTCCADVNMLVKQIKAQSSDVVELYYGDDNAVKMIDGKTIQIVALLEDERANAEE